MKKMRKLLPAFAMLLVSAIMLSTASFAWFSANTQATAAGMKIKAQTSGGLAIATWTKPGTAGEAGQDAVAPLDEDFKSTVNFGWSFGGTALAPTSHSGTTWYTAVADDVDSSTANKAGYTALSGFTAGYYNMTKWSFKTLEDGKKADVRLTGINVTGINEESAVNVNLAKSLRVAIHNVSDNTWFYFAPNQATDTTLYYVADAAGADSNATRTQYGTDGAKTIAYGAEPGTIVLTEVTSTTAEVIEVYIYFEGEDANCKTANAVNLDTISIDLVFTANTATAIG